MAAKMSTMSQLHSALAAMLLKMLEEGVPVGTDDAGEVIFRAPTAAELGVVVTFLKSNNITASVSDNDALKELQDKLMGKRKSIRPVLDDSDMVPTWQ